MSVAKQSYSCVSVDPHVMPQAVAGFGDFMTDGAGKLQAFDVICFNMISNVTQLVGTLPTLEALPHNPVKFIHSFLNAGLNKGLKI